MLHRFEISKESNGQWKTKTDQSAWKQIIRLEILAGITTLKHLDKRSFSLKQNWTAIVNSIVRCFQLFSKYFLMKAKNFINPNEGQKASNKTLMRTVSLEHEKSTFLFSWNQSK